MHRILRIVNVSVLVSLLLLLSIDAAKAQLPPAFSLPNAQAEPGELIPVNLDFSNDGQVGAININVEFDPNVVFFCSFFDAFRGPALDGLPVVNISTILTNGQLIISLDQGPAPVSPLPDGEIITINTCVNGSAQVGNSTSLDISVNSLTDTNGQDILPPVADTTSGSITVVNEPPQVIDVTINKSADTNRIDPGIPSLIAYTITLEGSGDPGAQATAVEVTDALPLGSSFRDDLSSPECEQLIGPLNTVGCDVGTVSAGEEITFDIVISITGQQGVDIVNQAIVDYLDELGNPIQKDSNTVTVRVRSGGGGGGGGGCTLTNSSNVPNSMANLAIFLIPGLVMIIRSIIFKKK
ncbi:MAG: cohesin domain-containing protein [Thermodesulfobacteriota bacterium]